MEKYLETSCAQIANELIVKAALKQDVFEISKACFSLLKKQAENMVQELTKLVSVKDKRIRLIFEEKSDFEFHLHLGGDVLVFLMHTNIFEIEPKNSLWNTSYLKQDQSRSYCGMIYVYNFLHDSFRYNRQNDIGYLVSRLFINKEKHFYLQGKDKISLDFNDFINDEFSQGKALEILDVLINYCLAFDLYVPPYEQVSQVSLEEIVSISHAQQLRTGKRLGFKFSIEE